jgi:creatinine amidohydrolase/Fe(II)-dependent formamide hydrolase-like protein
MNSVRLDELTCEEVATLLVGGGKRYGLLLPVGCTEQHGPELPLGCDTAIARGAAQNAARALVEHPVYGAVVMPDFSYAPSPGAEQMSGTVSVSFAWMGDGLCEILAAAVKTPWEYVAIVNAHAHNHGRVIEASMAGSQGRLGRRLPVVALNIYDYSIHAQAVGLNSGQHAGEFEIALYAYYAGPVKCVAGKEQGGAMRNRPPRIFGLDILPRSRRGVLSNPPPNTARALEQSKELGLRVDKNIIGDLVFNLDIYFSQWVP